MARHLSTGMAGPVSASSPQQQPLLAPPPLNVPAIATEVTSTRSGRAVKRPVRAGRKKARNRHCAVQASLDFQLGDDDGEEEESVEAVMPARTVPSVLRIKTPASRPAPRPKSPERTLGAVTEQFAPLNMPCDLTLELFFSVVALLKENSVPGYPGLVANELSELTGDKSTLILRALIIVHLFQVLSFAAFMTR